ncbi:MAG: GAF domain-containing protein [Acidobacteriota bacterium]
MDIEVHLDKVKKIIKDSKNPDEAMNSIVSYLEQNFSHYSWVGIYLVDGDNLILGPWKGPASTEHVKIPIGKGICGAAASSGKIELIPNVELDSRYLACFPSTKSEIVVPIKKDDKVLGEIDIDSDEINAFNEEDSKFLDNVAKLIVEIL